MLSILRFGVCRSSDLSIHVQRIFLRTNALFQPSLGAMTALPMTGFHRVQIALHGRQYFRNTAIFGILPAAIQSQIHRLQGAADSFHVRDSHPIPLFSEQECVSDCSGRAFATKAMLCNFRYNCSRFGGSACALRLGFSAVVSIPAKAGETLHKVCPSIRCANWDQNHSETLHKEFPLFSPKTGTTPFTVGFGNSAFADARLHCKPLHLTYQRFCCLALLRQNRVRSIKKPLLLCYLADKRSLVFSVYSV